MAGRTQNEVVITAPMDLVWRMTNDVESWPTLFTEYASAEILEQAGNRVRFRLTTHPEDDGKAWSWVSERIADPALRTVTARRIETGPLLESMNIRWEYEDASGPQGEAVRLRWIQEFQMRPDAPVDDHGAEAHLNRQTAVEMAHIKEVVERAAVLE
jgi:aromatase